jgi:hypothetical protein
MGTVILFVLAAVAAVTWCIWLERHPGDEVQQEETLVAEAKER